MPAILEVKADSVFELGIAPAAPGMNSLSALAPHPGKPIAGEPGVGVLRRSIEAEKPAASDRSTAAKASQRSGRTTGRSLRCE